MADLHETQPILTAGAPLAEADAVLVLLHGRGATARSILPLGDEVARLLPGLRLAMVAPQAANTTWYPYSFLAPLESNEPWLSSALERVAFIVSELADEGVPAERVVLAGFSQGACLASEYVARNARRWGGLGALSGGLIGPPDTPRAYDGSLDGTPVFLGCGMPDPHIPTERVRETAEVLEGLGADVDMRLYPGLGHTVNAEEIAVLAGIVGLLAESAAG